MPPQTPPPHFTPQQLEPYARIHVSYEVRMLIQTAERLEQRPPDPVLHDAAIEAFLCHARLLDDFLGCSTRPTPNDVLALDYSPSWQATRPLTGQLRPGVNAQVAHMSILRQAGYPWPITRMALDVAQVFDQFVSGLPATWTATFQPCRALVQGYRTATAARQIGLSMPATQTASSSPPIVQTFPKKP